MSYTLTSASREAYFNGVAGASAMVGYETGTSRNRVVRYAFTAPAEGLSALSFTGRVTRYDQYSDTAAVRFAVTLSDSSHRSANAASGIAAVSAPVTFNGTNYVVSGEYEINIAPNENFYVWFFPASKAYSLWSFGLIQTLTLTCETGSAAFASVDAAVETLGTLHAAVGSATAAMTHVLTLCDGDTALLTSEPFTGSAALTVPRSVFSAYPDKTATALTARLQAYSDAACTIPFGAAAAAAVTVTADPGMVPALPDAAVTLSVVNPNGAAVGAAVGQSRVRIAVDAAQVDLSAAPGASLAEIAVNGEPLAAPGYEYLSEVLNNNSSSFTVSVTDTRGRSCSVSRSVAAQDYAPPSITSGTAARCDASGTPDESGHFIAVKAGGVYSSLGGANSVSLSAAWRYKGGSYGAETELSPDVYKVIGGNIDPDKTVEVRFTLTDLLGRSAHTVVILGGRSWAMKFRADGNGVGFGMAPQTEKAVELPEGWRYLVAGENILSLAHPVGSVFWTADDAGPAALLGFGTWEKQTQTAPYAWKRVE